MNGDKHNMLIFEDNLSFASNIKRRFKSKFNITIVNNPNNLDDEHRWNNAWDVIICDVDMPGDFDGHELIKRRIEERRITTPVIIISGAPEVDLDKIKQKYQNTFIAYLDKNDTKHFFDDLETAVIKAVSQGSNECNILEELFKEIEKLKEPMGNNSQLKEYESLGLIKLAPADTISTLIKSCKEEESGWIKDFLWDVLGEFRKNRRRKKI